MGNMTARQQLTYPFIACAITLFFIAINFLYRPILPIDETRYVSVAWEMWLNKTWLVPHANGLPYSHKPPLLFWLFSSMWTLFGTSEFITRLTIPLFVLLNLFLIRKLAQKIYPDNPQAAALAPLVLCSGLGWFLYSGMIMFDLLLTVFVQTAMLSVWKYAETRRMVWIVSGGVAIGLGLLTKGPVTFIYLIPFVALVKWWNPDPQANHTAILKASVVMAAIGILIILAWAIPAAVVGGQDYAYAIFWGQSAGRIHESFAHARPFYWYLLLLPVLIFPWPFLVGFWRSGLWNNNQNSDKFCLAMFTIILALFSCFSGKQLHYLFPAFPVLAIWASNKLRPEKFNLEPVVIIFLAAATIAIFSASLWAPQVFRNAESANVIPWWGVLPLVLTALVMKPNVLTSSRLALHIIAVLLSLSALLASISPMINEIYNVTPIAQQINALQRQGNKVAYVGKYQNTFGYAGKLTAPIEQAPNNPNALQNYLQETQGYTVLIQKKPDIAQNINAILATPYRGGWLYIVDNQRYASQMELASE